MSALNDDEISQKLKDLTSRVNAARSEAGLDPAQKEPSPRARHDRMGLGFRIVTELVVCTSVGGAVGYGIDLWLEISPIGMVLGIGFGFAAGVTTIYRVVKGLDEAVGLGRAMRDKAGEAKTDADDTESRR